MAMARSESDSLVAQAAGLLAGERDRIANAANLSALLFMSLEDINWVGFYFTHGDELVVGPFQGKPACVRIPFGRGVCGKAATTSEIIRVADVEEFPDHIVCDVASRSEIVLPLVKSGEVIGVLDIDSPKPARFSTKDEALLSEIAAIYVNSID
jgi:L-methionine (R)-S-oxide reductase